MGAKTVVRRIFKLLLLDQILEIIYVIAIIVGLVSISISWQGSALLLAFVMVVYCLAAIAVYFWVINKLKRMFGTPE